MPAQHFEFEVLGKAQPQGSSRAFVPESWARAAVAQGRAPRAVVTSDNPGNKAWRHDVAYAALAALRGSGLAPPAFGARAVRLEVVFHLPRPKSLKDRIAPHLAAPDLDKLVRSVCDALTGIAWDDDKQVTEIEASKAYAPPGAGPKAAVRVILVPDLYY